LTIIAIAVLTLACVYSDGVDRTANLKVALRLNEQSKYSNGLANWDGADATGGLFNFGKFAFESMDATFDTVQDFELPNGRQKLIHARGSVAAVKFVPTAAAKSKYTGLFKGADSCVARLSTAAKPEDDKMAPGMALKCFRNWKQSGNIISMFSLDGQSSWDYFENEFTNIIEGPQAFALKFLEKVVFNRASHCATWLSTKQFAKIDQEGNEIPEDKIKRPIQLWFVPADIHFNKAPNHDDFKNDLATIPVGSKIWEVFGSDTKGGKREKIADIITDSKFVASSFGDNNLFYQHDR